MLNVERRNQEAYANLLKTEGVSKNKQLFLQKWLQFYLDFCTDYRYSVISPDSLDAFQICLSEINQPAEQTQPALSAARFYHKLLVRNSIPKPGTFLVRKPPAPPDKVEFPDAITSIKKEDSKNDANYNNQTTQHTLDGCSWINEFQRLENAIKSRHYSPKTLKSYSGYLRQFQDHTRSLDPNHLSTKHVKDFLTYLAVDKKVSPSTQNLAFNSLLFFFRHVLKQEFDQTVGVVRVKKRPAIPVVLSRKEIDEILDAIDVQYRLIFKLLYGCGLRLFECLNLRVQSLNFDAKILTIHDGKGQKDRTVPFPQVLQSELKDHLRSLQQLHSKDLQKGYGGVFLFNAIDHKYKNVSHEFICQWLFPAKQLTKEKKSNEMKRSHLHPTHVQKALRRATKKSTLTQRVTTHTFRHSFASHLLQNNYDIHTIQELLGHSDVRTTMVYTHTVKSVPVKLPKSPLDF